MRRPVALVSLATTTTVTGLAQACPYCAGRASGGLAFSILLGAVLLVPFAIVLMVVRFVRRGERSASRAKGGEG